MILEKYLQKIGITKDQLSDEEKRTFEDWEKNLKGREITSEDFSKWMKERKDLLIDVLVDPEASEKKKSLFAAELRLIRAIIRFLEIPDRLKESTEQNIEQLSKQAKQ